RGPSRGRRTRRTRGTAPAYRRRFAPQRAGGANWATWRPSGRALPRGFWLVLRLGELPLPDADDDPVRHAGVGERAAQVSLLRDLFGPLPFRPVTLSPSFR